MNRSVKFSLALGCGLIIAVAIAWSGVILGTSEAIAGVVLGAASTFAALLIARLMFQLVTRDAIVEQLLDAQRRLVGDLENGNGDGPTAEVVDRLVASLLTRKRHQSAELQCDDLCFDDTLLQVMRVMLDRGKLPVTVRNVLTGEPITNAARLEFGRIISGVTSPADVERVWRYLKRKRRIAIVLADRASPDAWETPSSPELPILRITVPLLEGVQRGYKSSWPPSPAVARLRLESEVETRLGALAGLGFADRAAVNVAFDWLVDLAYSNEIDEWPVPACSADRTVRRGLAALVSSGAIRWNTGSVALVDGGWSRFVRAYQLSNGRFRDSDEGVLSGGSISHQDERDLAAALLIARWHGKGEAVVPLEACSASLEGMVLAQVIVTVSNDSVGEHVRQVQTLWQKAQPEWSVTADEVKIGLIQLLGLVGSAACAQILWNAAVDPGRGDSFAVGDAYITTLALMRHNDTREISDHVSMFIEGVVNTDRLSSTPLDEDWEWVIQACHAAWLVPSLVVAQDYGAKAREALDLLLDASLDLDREVDVAIEISIAEGIRRALFVTPSSLSALDRPIRRILGCDSSWLAKIEVLRGLACCPNWATPELQDQVVRLHLSESEHFLVRKTADLLLQRVIQPSPSDYECLHGRVFELDERELMLVGATTALINLIESVGRSALDRHDRWRWREERGRLFRKSTVLEYSRGGRVTLKTDEQRFFVVADDAIVGRFVAPSVVSALAAQHCYSDVRRSRQWRNIYKMWQNIAS